MSVLTVQIESSYIKIRILKDNGHGFEQTSLNAVLRPKKSSPKTAMRYYGVAAESKLGNLLDTHELFYPVSNEGSVDNWEELRAILIHVITKQNIDPFGQKVQLKSNS